MSIATILVISDEERFRRALSRVLADHDYATIEAANPAKALSVVQRESPDLILVDIDISGGGGLGICRRVRQSSGIPMFAFSRHPTRHHKVVALDAGADECLLKPFATDELLAHIRATLRRLPPGSTTPCFADANISIDCKSRRLIVKGQYVRLTPKEFEVLKYLLADLDKPLKHGEILQAVWGVHSGEHEQENLRVVIRKLREKIETDPAQPRYIITEPWVGYRFQSPQVADQKGDASDNSKISTFCMATSDGRDSTGTR